jgi:hypothetical protein
MAMVVQREDTKSPEAKQNENQHHGQHDPEICNRWEVREIVRVVHKTAKRQKQERHGL